MRDWREGDKGIPGRAGFGWQWRPLETWGMRRRTPLALGSISMAKSLSIAVDTADFQHDWKET